jgi:hypothetical protein
VMSAHLNRDFVMKPFQRLESQENLFLVNAAIQPFKQLCGSDGEGVTNAEQRRERDGYPPQSVANGGRKKPNPIMSSWVKPWDLRSFFTRSSNARKNRSF